MKAKLIQVWFLMLLATITNAQKSSDPIVSKELIFEDKNGIVVVEAEHFYKQTKNENRFWYINSPEHHPQVWPDYDTATYSNAGGLAYIEALPDLFHTEGDPIIQNDNLGGAGTVAVLHYNVFFNKTGRYYIWTRLRSNDQEDNTTGAGVDEIYPKTAQILQSPVEKKEWTWKSENRVSRNPWIIGRASFDILTTGIHDVNFFMREDGEEFDRFILTTDSLFQINDGVGPSLTLRSGSLPKPFSLENTKPLLPMPLQNPDGSIYGANLMYRDTSGLISFEAENFYRQTKTDSRLWHLVTRNHTPSVGPDSDPEHLAEASENAYLELLPDGRQKDEDGINSKSSICSEGGMKAILSYMFEVTDTGKYYVWVRGFAVDGDDNTLHAGLNRNWPESGKKITFSGKIWKWTNTQRDTKAAIYVYVDKPGKHELQLSMREDGCEIDRIVLTRNRNFVPADSIQIPTLFRGNITSWYKNREKQMRTASKYVQTESAILIEVESVPVLEGWLYAADTLKHSGLGYLEWNLEGQGINPGKGVLKYKFEITESGNYQFLLRGKIKDPTNRMETPDPDGNDIWVKFNGGTDIKKQKSLGDGWNKIAILGHPAGWSWNTNSDIGEPHPVTPVCRYFEKGTYSVELSGRSQGYAIDKIAIVKYDKEPITNFENSDLEKFSTKKETNTTRL